MSVQSDKERLAELQDLLVKAERAPIVADLSRVGWIFQAYATNTSLLYRHITHPHEDFEVAMETRVPGFRPEIYHGYYAEMVRLILNYSASAASLVDHMRILSNKMENSNPDVWKQLMERRKPLEESNIHSFIKGLRNFVIHYNLPTIAGQISQSHPNANIEFDTLLDPEQLYIWKGWRSRAKEYMRENNPVSLSKTIADYDELVRSFYNWLFKDIAMVFYDNAKVVSDCLIGINNIEARLARE